MAKKGGIPTPEPAAEVHVSEQWSNRRAKLQPDGRAGILVRVRPEARKALKRIAVEEDVTLQDLMTEAIKDLLTKRGKPPTA